MESKSNPQGVPVCNQIIFCRQVLEAHNMYRRRHGVGPLELNSFVSKQCRECAAKIIGEESVRQSNYPIVGENIFFMSSDDPTYIPTGNIPVDAWYQQREQMELKQGPVNQNCINFSQVVWKSSQVLGVGMARSGNKFVVVCHYLPPGNVCGEYWQNVLPELLEAKKRTYAEVAGTSKV